jgi:hypothetical protein
LVNDKGQQIKTDGSEGFVYKISGCDELGWLFSNHCWVGKT